MKRYTQYPTPRRKYIPGQGVHPDKDPQGSHLPEIPVGEPVFSPQTWHRSQPYLYAIDLFNLGYWWEAHEVLEKLWMQNGRTTPVARTLQGIIQMAAALLQESKGNPRGASRLFVRGRANLEAGSGIDCGMDVGVLIQGMDNYLTGVQPSPPQIQLNFNTNG
jgi:hypothetical protein